MKEGEITLSKQDQTRLRVLADLEADRMTTFEAASALGITRRQLSTLRGRVRQEGPSGIRHRSSGRRPVNACDPRMADVVVRLWREKYEGANQMHFTEMLEREEGISLSRSTVRRMLAAHSISAPKQQKRSRHRRHRVRRAQAGSLIQMDGSDHDWLEGRGPRLTLVGGIDDATNRVWATFRLREDTRGYFEVLSQIIGENGLPTALYLDRTTIALGTKYTLERVQSGNVHYPTQMTKVLERLDILLIQARSPEAKGRVERLWRTLQDRLVSELRAKNICTLGKAQEVLRYHLHFHNRNFGKEALDPTPAWRSLPAEVAIHDAICWAYPRTVSKANTVSVDGTLLQLEFPASHPGWAGRRVEACRRLDRSWFARTFGEQVQATVLRDRTTGRAA